MNNSPSLDMYSTENKIFFRYALYSIEGEQLDEDELKHSWRDMLGKITNDGDWCKMLKSRDLVVLWQHYLRTDMIPQQ